MLLLTFGIITPIINIILLFFLFNVELPIFSAFSMNLGCIYENKFILIEKIYAKLCVKSYLSKYI